MTADELKSQLPTPEAAALNFCPVYTILRPFLASMAASASGIEAIVLTFLLSTLDKMCP